MYNKLAGWEARIMYIYFTYNRAYGIPYNTFYFYAYEWNHDL